MHGIRLARLVVGERGETSFRSDYARTDGLLDIHEFGYFWRHWLHKQTFDDVVHARERESEIDWNGLRRTLANVQHELGKPFVAKNVLAAYHLERIGETLGPISSGCTSSGIRSTPASRSSTRGGATTPTRAHGGATFRPSTRC